LLFSLVFRFRLEGHSSYTDCGLPSPHTAYFTCRFSPAQMSKVGGKPRKISTSYAKQPQQFYAVPMPDQYGNYPSTSGTPDRRKTDTNGLSAAQMEQLRRQSQQQAATVAPKQSVSSGPVMVKPPDRQQEAIELNTDKAINSKMATKPAVKLSNWLHIHSFAVVYCIYILILFRD
jgi:hypothetical protein